MSDRKDARDDEDPTAAAIAWLVRMQSDAATEQDWAGLTRWLEASPDHLIAFEAAERRLAELETATAEIKRALDRPTGQVLAFVPRPVSRRPRPSNAAPMALAASVAALVMFSTAGWMLTRATVTDYVAPAGASRAISLADGTHIQLDARTRVRVRLGWRSRQVVLGAGQAAFDVAKDPQRPFLIAVADQQVRVVGTEFNVADFDRQVVVTVRRGVVQVNQTDPAHTLVARLTAGQQLRHVVGSTQSQTLDLAPDASFAWTQGRLICNDRALSSIVAYLNHRYDAQISVSPAVADRRFSGVLDLGGQETDTVRHLALYLALKVKPTSGGFALY